MESKEPMYVERYDMACVYCATVTEGGCCGEIHKEMAYLIDDEIYLESELTTEMWQAFEYWQNLKIASKK